jgi:hypothetical protein
VPRDDVADSDLITLEGAVAGLRLTRPPPMPCTRCPAGPAGYLPPPDRPRHLGSLDRVECPIQFHLGGRDPYIPREAVQRVVNAVAGHLGVEVHVQEEAGHAFHNHMAPLFHHPAAAAVAWGADHQLPCARPPGLSRHGPNAARARDRPTNECDPGWDGRRVGQVLIPLFSARCFHCIDLDEFFGYDAVARRADSLSGQPCPLCAHPIRRDAITVVMDENNARRIDEGSVIWDKFGIKLRGFEDFLDDIRGKSSSSGIAATLRAQVSGAPSELRRRRCEVATTVVVGGLLSDFALQGALEAQEQGDHEAEQRAYQAIVDYARTDAIRQAARALHLGAVERQRNAPAEAVGLFRSVASAANGRIRAFAGYLLGEVLHETGDAESARRAWRDCVDRGEGYGQAKAAVKLAEVPEERPPREARELYEIALKCGDVRLSAQAALGLAMLEFRQGNNEKGLRLWQHAFEHGEGEVRAIAAFNLGMAWSLDESSPSKLARARKYYTIALGSSRPHVARLARERLDYLG